MNFHGVLEQGIHMVRFGVPGQNVDTLAYADGRLSTVPVVNAPRRPTTEDKKYPMWCEWRVNKNATAPAVEGEFWKLVRFESNGDATWVMFSGGSTGPAVNFETDDGAPNVVPDGVGEVQIFGGAGINVTGQGPGNTITIALAGGGVAIDQVDVDFNTAPGTDPVLPTATGQISIFGNTVTNGTNANSPVATHSRAANQFHVDVQLATARTGAPADPFDVGLCSFDDTMFTVDANGFVQLTGGGAAVDSVNVDFNTAPGTDPVLPDGTGQITHSGNVVTNGTNANAPVATHSRAANTYQTDVQLSTAITVPADPFDVGLSSFDTASFTVDGNGWVKPKYPFGPVPGPFNLGISYSSPTFTIHGADGTALSASNPGYVYMPSTSNPGQMVLHTFTSNFSFDDDSGTSDLTGNLWGTTTLIAWANAMPFYIYAVAKDSDADATFMISRVPHLSVSPAAAKIAKSGSAVASTQGSMFALDSSITVGDYDGNALLCLGSFRMAKNDAANNDWTVQAIDSFDGFGQFNESRSFTFPILQNGATSNTLSSSVGGDTIPTFNQTGQGYTINRNGLLIYAWSWDFITVSGVGTGTLRFHLPYTVQQASYRTEGQFVLKNNGAGTWNTGLGHISTPGANQKYYEVVSSGVGTAKYFPASLTTDKREGAFNVITRVAKE